MSGEMETGPLPERFEHLLQLIGSERFLLKQGLGNEVPFFICPFNATEAKEMEKLQEQLANQLLQRGVQVLTINLYDLAHEIMVREGDWDWHIEKEPTKNKHDLRGELQSILDIEKVVVPEIAVRMKESQWKVLFLQGIGEVFPYIRSHNVLNNLQKVAKDQPTVMFFPGKYSHSLEKGASLNLFGRLQDDKYYRAFNIYDCEV